MDKNILEQYTDAKEEVKIYKRKLEQQKKRKEKIVMDTVISAASHPYSPHPEKILGYDIKAYQKRMTKIEKITKQIEGAKDRALDLECEVYQFIMAIPDSALRQIFIYRYIDGETEEDTGKKVGYDRSTISKKITSYLENL